MTNQGTNYTLSTRPASNEDQAWLWEQYCTLLKPSITQQWGWDEALQYKNFHDHLPTSMFSIVENKDRAIAAYAAEEEKNRIYLHMLLVSSADQAQGIGSYVLGTLKIRARKISLPIELSVFNSNDVASFYLKNGFELKDSISDNQVYCWY